MKFISKSLKETKNIAKYIVNNFENKFILLNGQIGAGKTTLIKFIAEELKEKKNVTSPTFNIMKIYDKFVHIDAYKISGSLEEYEDYFYDKIIIIEWSKNLNEKFQNALKINVYMKKKHRIYFINK